MGATYVVVDNLEDALTYHKAGLLHWWDVVGQHWRAQAEVSDVYTPPVQAEIRDEQWGILVEDEE